MKRYAQEVINNPSNSDEILEMNGRFDLLLKLRAINLEQMRDILVNSVRKCSRVVELGFMSMLKTTKEKQTVYPTFLEEDPSFGQSFGPSFALWFTYFVFLSLRSATNQDSHRAEYSVHLSTDPFLSLVIPRVFP